jgi:hypothetical protein
MCCDKDRKPIYHRPGAETVAANGQVEVTKEGLTKEGVEAALSGIVGATIRLKNWAAGVVEVGDGNYAHNPKGGAEDLQAALSILPS